MKSYIILFVLISIISSSSFATTTSLDKVNAYIQLAESRSEEELVGEGKWISEYSLPSLTEDRIFQARGTSIEEAKTRSILMCVKYRCNMHNQILNHDFAALKEFDENKLYVSLKAQGYTDKQIHLIQKKLHHTDIDNTCLDANNMMKISIVNSCLTVPRSVYRQIIQE